MSSLNHNRKHPNPEKACSCDYRVIFVLLLFLLYPYYNLSTEKVEFSHVLILAVNHISIYLSISICYDISLLVSAGAVKSFPSFTSPDISLLWSVRASPRVFAVSHKVADVD